MHVRQGPGKTECGPGIEVVLSGDEVASAIDDYIEKRGVTVSGPRTITVNGALCYQGRVYVDPSGHVIVKPV